MSPLSGGEVFVVGPLASGGPDRREEDLGAIENWQFGYGDSSNAGDAQVFSVGEKNIFAMTRRVHPSVDKSFREAVIAMRPNCRAIGCIAENGRPAILPLVKRFT